MKYVDSIDTYMCCKTIFIVVEKTIACEDFKNTLKPFFLTKRILSLTFNILSDILKYFGLRMYDTKKT